MFRMSLAILTESTFDWVETARRYQSSSSWDSISENLFFSSGAGPECAVPMLILLLHTVSRRSSSRTVGNPEVVHLSEEVGMVRLAFGPVPRRNRSALV
jgi:hypothetical protein